ncbi:hypothetical protein [Bernardetia sp.]|uniref:hypothetical protein n=1 Tax=Bernardetia sp. TaxID=1937974 RepID=UPI0025C4EE35|nr:hypothetical protein [Bernardetia sp.]
MKKQYFNKYTLLLAFLAVGVWSFYFWQKKENQELVEETQAIIIDFHEKSRIIKQDNNEKFLRRVKSSWLDSIGFMRHYPKSTLKEDFYKNVPEEYILYLKYINEFENEFFYSKRYDTKFKYNNEHRKELLSNIEKHFQNVTNHPSIEKTGYHKVDWEETDDESIWFDLVQQRSEIIQIIDSIFEQSRKQFPTSYSSNNFEGYSTLIPNYENQSMLIKAYWFPSDTKYYSDYGKKNRMGLVPKDFKFQDSIYDPFSNPKLLYTFYEAGDTIIYPIPLAKEAKEIEAEHEGLSIPFKVIPNQNSDEK